MTRILVAVRLAFAFLTIVRIPLHDSLVTPRSLADARFAYPLVGLTIGLALAAISLVLGKLGAGSGVAAFCLVAVSALLSGGLHLDGLADSADGLFLWGDRERRLSVMRDPHVGSFGVVAIVLVILGKYAALDSLGTTVRPLALLLASVSSRSLILVVSGLAPYARPEGTGRVLIDATTRRDAALGSLLTVVAGVCLVGWVGLLASLTVLALTGIFTRTAKQRLGGVTGDILGATVEWSEVVWLGMLAVWLK